MSKAALRIQISDTSIDDDKGIIPACKLAEVGRLAVFAGEDGSKKELLISPALIESLLGLATGKGRLDAYWTHDRLNAENKDADALHSSVGVWRNFRKDGDGNLVADINLAPTEYRERILWQAHNDPQGIMTSLVFDYTGGKDNAKAVTLESGDFVKQGAAVTALLSAYNKTHKAKLANMDDLISQLVEACKDPHSLAAFKALIKSVEKEGEAADSAAMSDDDATAIMTAAGVTDADKLDADKGKPLGVRVALSVGRATTRRLASVGAEAAVTAEARLSSAIGTKVTAALAGVKKESEEPEAFITAQLAAGCPNRATAIARMAKDKKELYATFRA